MIYKGFFPAAAICAIKFVSDFRVIYKGFPAAAAMDRAKRWWFSPPFRKLDRVNRVFLTPSKAIVRRETKTSEDETRSLQNQRWLVCEKRNVLVNKSSKALLSAVQRKDESKFL